MLNRSLTIESAGGMAPADGALLMLRCDKRDGLTIQKVRGFAKEDVRRIDPTDAEVVKVGHGRYSAWLGRHLGAWDVRVGHRGGVTTLRMRSKGDAYALAKWIEKYSARKGGE